MSDQSDHEEILNEADGDEDDAGDMDIEDDVVFLAPHGLSAIAARARGLEEEEDAPDATMGGAMAECLPEPLRAALEAIRTDAEPASLLPLLNAARAQLEEYIFRCPLPPRPQGGAPLDEPSRQRALTWLLVLDYVNAQQAAGQLLPQDMSRDPMPIVKQVGDTAPHKVCQHAFKKNDIVWICKNCQKDETCVLCNACFLHSRHQGHEVYFYHTQAGGCCDCGDEDAWEPAGFCDRHGKDSDDPLTHLPPPFVHGARGVLSRAVGLLLAVADAVVESYEPARFPALPCAGPDVRYYVMVHFGDVHTKREIRESLVLNLGISEQMAREYTEQAAQTGEAVVLDGPLEEAAEAATRLRRGGRLSVTLMTKALYKMIKCAQLHVQWLHALAGVSGGLCRMVVEQLGPAALEKLMLAHGRLPRRLALALHTLYLFLMADQSFKASIAQSYASTYLKVSDDFGHGVGVAEHSLYTLSVQFLNRSSFVNDLVENKHFLSVLCKALRDMMERKSAARARLAPPYDRVYGFIKVNSMVYQFRRYSAVVSDLKFVLNIPGVSARFCAGSCLDSWLGLMGQLQWLHAQAREVGAHVEFESKDWMYAFNVQISLCHVLDCLLLWVRGAAPPGPGAPRVDTVASKVAARISGWLGDMGDEVGDTPGPPVVRAPLYPQGELDTLRLPLRKSFHIPLHRMLAVLLKEAAKNTHLSAGPEGQGSLAAIVQGWAADRRLVQGLVEIPLSVLALGAEVRSGLWRRNGHMMMDQVVNYADAPFCRIFKDMDILLLQCAGLAYGCKELVNLLLLRFHVHGWLLRGEPVSEGMSEELEPAALLLLAEEALHTLIVLATELCLPPMDHAQRVKCFLHREVLHRLASGPCTYSELQEGCHQFMEACENVPEQLLEAVLGEVANRREARELEPEKFVMKEAAWVGYDPAFYHITVQAHQQASECRPKPKGPTPLSAPPPPAHPALAALRLGLLATDAVMQVARQVLRDAVEPPSRGPRTYSDLLLFRVLHVLTLAVHAAAEAREGRDRDRLFELLRMEEPAGAAGGSRKRSEAPRDEEGGAVGAEAAQPAQPSGSVLALVLALPEVGGVKADPHLLQAVQWLLDEMGRQDARCEAAIRAARQQGAEPSRLQDAEARKRQARERLLSQMQRSAASFLSSTPDLGDEEMDDADEAAGGDASQAAGKPKGGGVPECMACRGVREGGTLGYAAFCQRSSVLAYSEPQSPCPGRREGLVLQLCGHAMHYECFDGFFATVVEQSEAMGHLIYDVTLREFPCPLCKAISNVLVPFVPEGPKLQTLAWPGDGGERKQPARAEGEALDEAGGGEETGAEAEGGDGVAQEPQSESPVPMGMSPDRPTRRPGAEAAEAASPGSEGDKPADAEEQALQTAAWSLLADVTRVALQGGPLPKGLGPDSVLMVCEALAYTLAAAQVEQGPEVAGPAAVRGQEGLPALSRLAWVAAALQHVEGYSGSNTLSGDLERCLDGHSALTKRQAEEEGRTPCKSHSGLLNLTAPLLTQNLWCLLVAAAVDTGIGERPEVWDVRALVQGLTLARALQVLWERGGVFAVEGGHMRSAEVREALEGQADYLARATARAAMDLGAALPSRLVEALPPAAAVERLGRMGEVLRTADAACQAFVRCAVLLLAVLTEAGMLPPQALPRVQTVQDAMATLEIPHLTEALKDPRWLRLATAWIEEASLAGRPQDVRSLDFPVWARARFHDLRSSYTELHADVTSRIERGPANLARPPAEHPAICFVCGTALAAGGGECTRHAQVCGQGTGVMFLLQECSVLLVYGPRASYFHSPYVDSYGERHKHFRGRPLFLDERRIEALRKLWANQRVAYEVVLSRSTAKQVVHNFWY